MNLRALPKGRGDSTLPFFRIETTCYVDLIYPLLPLIGMFGLLGTFLISVDPFGRIFKKFISNFLKEPKNNKLILNHIYQQ